MDLSRPSGMRSVQPRVMLKLTTGCHRTDLQQKRCKWSIPVGTVNFSVQQLVWRLMFRTLCRDVDLSQKHNKKGVPCPRGIFPGQRIAHPAKPSIGCPLLWSCSCFLGSVSPRRVCHKNITIKDSPCQRRILLYSKTLCWSCPKTPWSRAVWGPPIRANEEFFWPAYRAADVPGRTPR